jgi:hypothetical protein
VLAAAIVLTPVAAHASGGPEQLTLRLVDLPPGYLVGDDRGCGLSLFGEGAPPELRGLRQHHHRGCGIEFERLWIPLGEAAGPALVESAAYRFATDDGAVAAFAAARHLAAFVFGLRPASLELLQPAVAIGDAATAFTTNDALVRGRPRRPGVVLLWRSGRVLSLVFTSGRPGAVGAPAATLRLAEQQQARVRAPTTLRRRDNDDRLVPLDNPGLGIDVLWLGRRFRPAGGTPMLTVANSHGPLRRWSGPGWRAEIDYSTRGRGGGVKLGLWRPRAFARFSRSRLGRLVRGQRCARATRIGLPRGRAVIYAGYDSPPQRCAERAPDRYLAHVFLSGVVVTVNVPFCLLCEGPERGGPGPYDSLSAMRAVIEGLRPRSP